MNTPNHSTAGPKKYPLSLKKFLTILLPKLYNKPKRREAAWREFRKSEQARLTHISLGKNNWLTIQEIANNVSDKSTILSEGDYFILARSFLSWYEHWRKEKTSNVRRAAAHNSHKKTGARPNWVALKEIGKKGH